jgi:hypothetical protein
MILSVVDRNATGDDEYDCDPLVLYLKLMNGGRIGFLNESKKRRKRGRTGWNQNRFHHQPRRTE